MLVFSKLNHISSAFSPVISYISIVLFSSVYIPVA